MKFLCIVRCVKSENSTKLLSREGSMKQRNTVKARFLKQCDICSLPPLVCEVFLAWCIFTGSVLGLRRFYSDLNHSQAKGFVNHNVGLGGWMYISEKCAVSQTKQRWYGSLRGPRVTTGSQVRGGVGPHRVPCLPGPVAGTPCGTPRQVAGLLMTGYNPRIIDGRCQNYPPEKSARNLVEICWIWIGVVI